MCAQTHMRATHIPILMASPRSRIFLSLSRPPPPHPQPITACGLDGIRQAIEPPPPFVGDIYSAEGFTRLPASLAEATERMAQSGFAKRAFGDDVIEHYVHFFRNEVRSFYHHVTDWERARYFERI